MDNMALKVCIHEYKAKRLGKSVEIGVDKDSLLVTGVQYKYTIYIHCVCKRNTRLAYNNSKHRALEFFRNMCKAREKELQA